MSALRPDRREVAREEARQGANRAGLRDFTSKRPLEALRSKPVINLLADLILRYAIALLNLAFEFLTASIDRSEVIISELTPLRFDFAFELFPTALNTVPVHG